MQGDERAQTTVVSRPVGHSLPAHFGFTDEGGSQTESCLSLLSVVSVTSLLTGALLKTSTFRHRINDHAMALCKTFSSHDDSIWEHFSQSMTIKCFGFKAISFHISKHCIN